MEFALVVVPLLMIVFGIINFGIYFAQSLALNNAAREGARFGAVRGHDCAEIQALVNGSASSLAMDDSDVDTDIENAGGGACTGAAEPCTGSEPGDRIVVTTTHEYELLVPMLIPGFPDSFGVEGHGEFRCEYS